ncbi:MAG: sulfite oxidase-like oxidoreductase [Anaerolineae bacterium]|nr:sulfite oxidase-like oxidoreductase [Anaerolineae bacterium]MDW8300180.1 sulfite oxidase-like oxidoreductase [Anaerolineae bacterium]
MFESFLNRRRKEEEVRDSGRLPPGQSLTQKFPVLHYGAVPIYNDLSKWTFRIFGLVEQERVWTWEEFCALPRTEVVYDIHCVTGWSKFDTRWSGVHLKTLIDMGLLKLRPEARYAIQHCEFGYTTNTPVEVVLASNFLLATHYDGQPLTPEHGYPLRGLMGAIPGQPQESDRYLWKGGKWLRAIEFTAEDRPGFWEQAGYSNTANVWREERYWRGLR